MSHRFHGSYGLISLAVMVEIAEKNICEICGICVRKTKKL